MGVAYNRTQVIQTALNLLGFGQIQSIEAGGPGAQAMNQIYDTLMAADLSSPNWRFATKTAVLSQLAGVDPDFIWYNTAYKIPPDCLAIWQVYPNVPYEVYGERIWTTGTQELQMQYRAVVPESMMPPSYIMYFCYLLAEACFAIAKDNTVYDKIEKGITKWRAQAMLVNSQGRPNQGLTNSPWISGRVAGSFYGTAVVG